MRIMQFALPALATVAALAVFVPASGHADPYKWCAQYGGEDGGGTNCGFVTIEQCRATISGMGGFCVPNQFYTGDRVIERPHRRTTGKRVRE